MITRDGLFYLSLTPVIDSFSCIHFISGSGLFDCRFFDCRRPPYCDVNMVMLSDVITFSDVNLTMAYLDILYSQCISNMWKFSIFTFPTGWIRVFEIRFAGTGVICGNPYPVCKKLCKFQLQHNTIHLRATSSKKPPSNICKMCRFISSCASAKHHPELCSPLVVSC